MNVGHCDERVVRRHPGAGRQAAAHLHPRRDLRALRGAVREARRAAAARRARPRRCWSTRGAEAVENAIKIARQATGRPAVICFTEAFHGRTMMCMTLTSKTGYKIGCGPFAPEVYRLPYPNHFRYGDGLSMEAFVRARAAAAARRRSSTASPAEHVAAIDHRAGAGRGRLRAGAGGLPARPARDLRRARHPADLRRGAVGLLPHRRAGRPTSTPASSPTSRPGPSRMGGGLPIAAVIGQGRGHGRGPARARSAAPTAATRWPAPRRWPRSSRWSELDLNARARAHRRRSCAQRFEALQRALRRSSPTCAGSAR